MLSSNYGIDCGKFQGVWSEMDLEWSGEVSLTLAARVNSKSSAQGDNSKTFEVCIFSTTFSQVTWVTWVSCSPTIKMELSLFKLV